MPNFCKYCGASLQPQDRFCGSCGSRIIAKENTAKGEILSRESIASDAVQKMADGIAKEIRSFQNGEQEVYLAIYNGAASI